MNTETKPVTRYVAIYRHEDSPKHELEYEFTDADIHAVGTDPAEWATTWCPKGYYLHDLVEAVDGPTDVLYRWLATAFGWTITLAMGVAFGAMFIWMFFIATN